MTVQELNQQTERIENMTKRGLLTISESEQRIAQLIDEALPDEAILDEESWRRMEQKRLVKRRSWRFLLQMTAKSSEVI